MSRIPNFGGYVAALALLLFGFAANGQGPHVELKPEVLGALKAATKVVLYSLVPDPGMDPKDPSTLTGYKILGGVTLDKQSAKSAIAQLLPTIDQWEASRTRCVLQPRIGLRITANGGDYIFLLCYQCGDIYLITPTSNGACLHLVRGPDVYNHLLERNKIPLTP
jgi:hypothetical protein